MSIYASIFGFDAEDGKNGPIAYQGSHILPSSKDKRGGYLGIAAIPGHISRGKRKAISDDMQPYWPWLRVSLDGPTDSAVILNRKQVIGLRDALDEWLKLAPPSLRNERNTK
jgi:hypothetical protein